LSVAPDNTAIQASEVASAQVEETAREFVGYLLGPAWPIGWAALEAGLAVLIAGVSNLVRRTDAARDD
jgi:hypothetical protein